MTDDYAIEGEDAGYVPCFELPAALLVEEEGAISGIGTGFVAANAEAAALPAQEDAAIVGSAVGFVAKDCCPWIWQNGTGDGLVGSGWWSIGGGCLLSLDVQAGPISDDFVVFELPENAETADHYTAIRAGVTLSAVIYTPFIPTNTVQPGINDPTEEAAHSISVFARDDPNTVTTRIEAWFRLFSASIPGFPDNGLVELTMFQKQATMWFPATVGYHTLSLTITPLSTTATVDGNNANLNTSITPPNLAPPPVDMDSLAQLRVREGTNDMTLPGVFTAQPSLP